MRLEQTQLDDLFDPLHIEADHIAVAVSGGADSLALCFLAAQWARENQKSLTALSVNHGLRPQALEECAWVHEVLKERGIAHETLTWNGAIPTSNVQAKAREIRYQLLEEWCVSCGVVDLLLGHHLDDQAETFILRLARGSGVDGLSSMAKVTPSGRLRLLRPLLDTSKEELTSYLRTQGHDWIEDPSNDNRDFERVKVRQSMEALSELGLTPERLAQTALHMARARHALEETTNDVLHQTVNIYEEGYLTADFERLSDQPDEIFYRCLSRMGQAVGGAGYPPRFERLEGLGQKLKNTETATLMGCRWVWHDGRLWVCREVRENMQPTGVGPLWDGRFSFENHAQFSGLRIAALGARGWQEIVERDRTFKDSPLLQSVRESLPCLREKSDILWVPHLGFGPQKDSESSVEWPNLTFCGALRLFS